MKQTLYHTTKNNVIKKVDNKKNHKIRVGIIWVNPCSPYMILSVCPVRLLSPEQGTITEHHQMWPQIQKLSQNKNKHVVIKTFQPKCLVYNIFQLNNMFNNIPIIFNSYIFSFILIYQ